MREEERARLREAPSLIPSNCLFLSSKLVIMMAMRTIMINMRVMIVSTDMIEMIVLMMMMKGGVTWHCLALAEFRMQKGRSKTRN